MLNMIDSHTAEIASAALGLLGSLLLAIPFFADYGAKRTRFRKLKNLKAGALSAEDAAALRGPTERVALERVLAADTKMALCSGVGCVLLLLSFVALLAKAS